MGESDYQTESAMKALKSVRLLSGVTRPPIEMEQVPGGLQAGNTYELISHRSNITAVFNTMIMNTVLPEGDGGRGEQVVVVDCVGHICLQRLRRLLAERLRAQHDGLQLVQAVEECLQRMFVLRSTSVDHLLSSLQTLPTWMHDHASISTLIIDCPWSLPAAHRSYFQRLVADICSSLTLVGLVHSQRFGKPAKDALPLQWTRVYLDPIAPHQQRRSHANDASFGFSVSNMK